MLEAALTDDERLADRSYRERIYAHYAQNFQDADMDFDAAAAARWSAAYAYYLHGWLPPPAAPIVDLACGGGRMLYFLRERGYANLCGVDVSADQVALARQVTKNVAQEDVLDFLSRREASFDLITGLDIIEHLHKSEVLEFLDACNRALRPGGRLILQTPNADSPWGTMYRYGDFTHEVCFNPNSLSRLMGLCGYHEIECREMGPIATGYSVAATIRSVVWQAIRISLKVWNLAELGHAGSGILTRIFLISAKKPERS